MDISDKLKYVDRNGATYFFYCRRKRNGLSKFGDYGDRSDVAKYYSIKELDKVDACEYAKQFGKTEIERCLRMR